MTIMAKGLKRAGDILLIILASPFIIIVYVFLALLVWLTSGRPVIFRQERAGRGMKPFILYKFRTMRTEVDPFGPSPKEGADPRLTKIGVFLRKTSLDELPQLWNVLRGDMSLVGPRPLYLEQAREWNERQRRRLEVKPGLTGLAQISGRGSLTIEEKLELDVKYVENQSLWQDCRIIYLTFISVFRGADIYEKKYSQTQETRKKS